MDPKIQSALEKEEQSEFHKRILADSKALVAISRNKMKEFYPVWDRNDDIFRGLRRRTATDVSASNRDEPEKQVVPISYSQTMTFVAFCFSLFTQKENFYELVGFTAEDEPSAKVGEALLERDLSHNQFKAKLHQFLLDIARFGLGVFKTTWATEKQHVKEESVVPPSQFLGAQIGGDAEPTEEVKEIVSYQGNKIVNISPYRFFPDVRLPIVRFQEGEFCGSEEIYSMSQLKSWQNDGVVAGVEFIKPLGKEANTIDRAQRWDDGEDPNDARTASTRGDGQLKKSVIVLELQRTLIPKEYEVEDGVPLGPEDYPIKYIIRIANDNRVISVEPMDYAHQEFTYSIAPFVFDNNVFLGSGLSDIIDQLQSTITWFINSRITSVRKVISNYLVVNPKYFNMKDFSDRKPIIRLLESAPGDLDRVIKQLTIQDVTTKHIDDAKYLHEIIQVVTGINDTILGQFQPGRRPATEHRNVASGAAARLRAIASIIWTFALESMGKQMLSNLRDGLDEETFVRVMGQKAATAPEFTAVTKEDLVGHYAFEIFDGTTPSERLYNSQALSDIVMGFIQNPESAIALGYDVKKLFDEMLVLRGIRNPERFALTPEQIAAYQAQQATQQAQQTTTSNGKPGTNGRPTNGSPSGSATPAGQPILPTASFPPSSGGGR